VHSLPADGYQGDYPKLPSGHHRSTRKWYETWARSPQAAAFIDTDWQRLQQLAFVVDELYSPTLDFRDKPIMPAIAVLAEIRQQEQKFGATVLDRASLYMTIERPEDKPAAANEQSQRSAARRQALHVVDDATAV
jgi:hypothetical protein